MEQERKDIAHYQPLEEGQGQVLVFAYTKTLPHPFVESLVPGDSPSNRADSFVFFSHTHSLTTASLTSPAHLLLH